MNNHIFTIITICYNSEKTIERTIKSILDQTYQDYEYIIVDGASKDGTLDIIKKYEPLFEGRMKWKSEPDKGIYNAMNKGIQRSSGEIIGIVNSDDWLEPKTLQIIADEISIDESLRQSILTGEILFHNEDGTTLLYPTSKEIYEHYSKQYRMGLNHPATFVPKCVYDETGLFDENFKLYADSDFILRCYENKIPVHFIHKVLSNMADGGASNTHSTKELKDSILKYKKHVSDRKLLLYYSFKTFVFWFVIGITPHWLLKYYRRFKNK